MDRFNLKTHLAYFTDCEGLFRDAYEAYLKKGQPCLIPGIGKHNVLSMRGSFREIGQIDWAGDSYDSRKCLTDSWLISPPDTAAVERRIPNWNGWTETPPLWETVKLIFAFAQRALASLVVGNALSLLREEIEAVLPRECYTIPSLSAGTAGTAHVESQDMKKGSFCAKPIARTALVTASSRGASTIDPFGRETPAVSILSLSLPTCYDTGVFEDPHKFNPWRFAKRRQAQNQGQGHGDSADNKQDDSKGFAQSIVTYNSIIIIQHGNPSPQHPPPNLPFGHGRHSLTNLVHMNLKK
ncbi:uncharacterized protein PADG_04923 [Paracoccidioides brasiliensis Pb18]|uniref:Uncharacterized protein n=1 Tax=Paracoccidioides brasiliensis (strain Pb18) TaxID=502780 RepID=C1GBC2_PARBD|nr:uncharacterized protein PADG_04923 [Paracoccidioides brasiliensis Pb18]EEH48844.2 hypothetical protein PADG_04923 [Paracoccidioides brasiliensis Pb18]